MGVSEKYSYDRFGSTGMRVGQAVYDILSKDQPSYTVEEILEGMGPNIVKYIYKAAVEGCKKYPGEFYVLHLFHKGMAEYGVENVMKQSARHFEKKWTPREVMNYHPNSTKTLYAVDSRSGMLQLLWTVPGREDCISIKKNPKLYDPKLVKWVNQAT